MKNPFLDDDDFFKSQELNEHGQLVKARPTKYIKRVKTASGYRYVYKDEGEGKRGAAKKDLATEAYGKKAVTSYRNLISDLENKGVKLTEQDKFNIHKRLEQKESPKKVMAAYSKGKEAKVGAKSFGSFGDAAATFKKAGYALQYKQWEKNDNVYAGWVAKKGGTEKNLTKPDFVGPIEDFAGKKGDVNQVLPKDTAEDEFSENSKELSTAFAQALKKLS